MTTDRQQIKDQIKELRRQLNAWGDAYYNEDSSPVDDATYDAALRQLETLESEFPDLITEDSPTQVVGGTPSPHLGKVTHRVPMASLQDVFSHEEVDQWLSRVSHLTAKLQNDLTFSVEPKVDGLSIALTYIDGEYARAATRGNGTIGEDVTDAIRALHGVPMSLVDPIPYLEVRAEVYMPYKSFEALNRLQEQNNAPLYANPRNAAAGTIRRLETDQVQARGLRYHAFNIQYAEGITFNTHHESLAWLGAQGFDVITPWGQNIHSDVIESLLTQAETSRLSMAYGIDGVVIKLEDLALRTQVGATSKVPRWAVAYKFTAEEGTTQVEAIDVQVGRTGKLTPLAILKPITLAGSTIRRATLNNEDYIAEKDVRVGDYVIIRKAGDIIPEIVRVDFGKRSAEVTPFIFPTHCPVCGAEVERDPDASATRCTGLNCPAQQHRRLLHFASRQAMDIRGLGDGAITQLTNAGFLNSIVDIYELHKQRTDLIALPSWGEQSVDQLLVAIEQSKSQSLDRFIHGLGIIHVGAVTARTLAKHVPHLDALREMTIEELTTLPDIGATTAQSIHHFLNEPHNIETLATLKSLGLNMMSETFENDVASESTRLSPFTDQTIVLTGTLSQYARSEAGALIEQLGGRVTNSVTQKTSFVVAGEKPGSKVQKAKSLGIKIIDEDTFISLLKPFLEGHRE